MKQRFRDHLPTLSIVALVTAGAVLVSLKAFPTWRDQPAWPLVLVGGTFLAVLIFFDGYSATHRFIREQFSPTKPLESVIDKKQVASQTFEFDHGNKLALKITKHFNLDEIDSLCLSLGINPEEIAGNTLTRKAENLVSYCLRREMMPNLIDALQNARPMANWNYDEKQGKKVEQSKSDSIQNETYVLIYKDILSQESIQISLNEAESLQSIEPEVLSDIDLQIIEKIVRYLMSEQHHEYNPNWFVRRREVMETSFTVISSVTDHVDVLARVPEMAKDVRDSCHQLSSQAIDLIHLLERIGIGPDSPGPRRNLLNNIFLVDERASKAAQKLDHLLDSYYAGRSLDNLPTELRVSLQSLQTSTKYTLHWLNYTIDQLDKHVPQ